jgi:hypothetical protein
MIVWRGISIVPNSISVTCIDVSETCIQSTLELLKEQMLNQHCTLVYLCKFLISGSKVLGDPSEEILVVIGLFILADDQDVISMPALFPLCVNCHSYVGDLFRLHLGG